jgi:hypothetical protein
MPKVSEFTELTRLGTGVQLTAVGEKLVAPYLLRDGVTVSQVVSSAGGPHQGGTLTGGSWTQRNLNVAINSVTGVPAGLPSWFTLSIPTFTIAAGFYSFDGYACGFGVDSHICAVRLVSGTIPFIIGTPENSSSVTPTMTKSTFSMTGYFENWELDLATRCDTTRATDGGGFIGSLGMFNQIFAQVRIVRLS